MTVQKEDFTKEFQAESEGSILEMINELKEVLQRKDKVLKGYPEEMGEEAEETAIEKEKTATEIEKTHSLRSLCLDIELSRREIRLKMSRTERKEILKLNDLLLKILTSGDQPPRMAAEPLTRMFDLMDNEKKWLLSNLALETLFLPRIRKFLIEIINKEPRFPQELLPINYDRISAFDVLSILVQDRDLWIRSSWAMYLVHYLRTFRYYIGNLEDPFRSCVEVLMRIINVPWKDAKQLLSDIDDFRARGLSLLAKVSGKKESDQIPFSLDEYPVVRLMDIQTESEPTKEAKKQVGQQDIQSESELTKGASKKIEEAEKLVGQKDIQPDSELTKPGASMEDEVSGAEELSLVGQQDNQPESEPTKGASEETEEAEKQYGQQDIQSKSELTKRASKESEEAEKLVGQQDIQPESELTKPGASRKGEVSEAEKLRLVGQQDIQPESEPSKGASEESRGAEKVVGQRDKPEGELTKCATKESEEAQQEQYHKIIEKTKKFEALHKECIRVLPYLDELSDQVYVRLYVFCGNDYITAKLRADAQECFRGMGVELKWTDLYNKAFDEPKISAGLSKGMEKSQVDEISKIIKTSLPAFEKHRNIIAIYPSLKIIKSEQTKEPCVMISVVGKRFIPIGESDFPKRVGVYSVDIVEGFWIETAGLIEAQVEHPYLRLGASIGIKESRDSGTLGAFLKDNHGQFYLLSCDHVINGNEVVHPGELHYLNSIFETLTEYDGLLKEITGYTTNFHLHNLQLTRAGLLAEFRRLQNMSDKFPYDYLPACRRFSGKYKDFIQSANKLEEMFKHPPRVVADRSFHFNGNVRVHNVSTIAPECPTFFIDAAAAKLTTGEVEALRGNYVEIIGTTKSPNGNVITLGDSTQARLPGTKWLKSGSNTGCTSKDCPVQVYVRPKYGDDVEVAHLNYQNNALVKEQNYFEWKCCWILQNTWKTFAYYGDSGAVIFENYEGLESMPGLGVVVGGFSSQDISGVIFSPLDIVLKTLSGLSRTELTLVPSIFG